MRGLGFEQCEADACVMRLREERAVFILVVVLLDDIFAMGFNSRCDKSCEDLNRFVPINNLGGLRWYAACRFSRDWSAGTLTTSQQDFAEGIVSKFGVAHGNSMPMAVDLKLYRFDRNEPNADVPFRSLVGHLMWIANQTQPDILNAVRVVARYSAAPKLWNCQAALHIVMYIKSTSTYGIAFQGSLRCGAKLELYVDADYADEANDRRSVSGGVVMCAGACVSFYSINKTQRCVTLSSTETEYVAMAKGFRETVFMRCIWSLFPDRNGGCTPVNEDNKGAIHLAINPATTFNSKHIEVRQHFLRERVAIGEFKVIHVPSAQQHADFLTKSLPTEAFRVHRNFVMNLW